MVNIFLPFLMEHVLYFLSPPYRRNACLHLHMEDFNPLITLPGPVSCVFFLFLSLGFCCGSGGFFLFFSFLLFILHENRKNRQNFSQNICAQ